MQKSGEIANLKIYPVQNIYPDILDENITDITIILWNGWLRSEKQKNNVAKDKT